jgi:S-layer homology domain
VSWGVRTLGLDPLPAEQCPFAEVEAYWPYPHGYVATAAQNQITVGSTLDSFAPYDYISRAQVVTMVVRALENLRPGTLDDPPPGYGTLGDFSPDHAANMTKAEYGGLLAGLQGFGSAWNPWQNPTRGEVAQLLWNMLQEWKVWAAMSAGRRSCLAIDQQGSLWA